MRFDFTVAERDDRLAEIEREEVLRDPGFGKTFTDHMVMAIWTLGQGWHDAEVTAYGPLLIDPATAVLHYAQEIFEGMKAYRHADGSVWTFRPEANAARFNRSARRLALPELPEHDFIESLKALVVDRRRLGARAGPSGRRASTCARSCIASEAFLGVRPSRRGHLLRDRLAGRPPTSPGGVKPVSLWISTDYRAGRRRRHRRRQVRRQLRRPASPPSWRPPSTAATRWCSSTPRRTRTSRSSAG